MDFSQINELISIKKKSEASNEKKQMYYNEMMLMLDELGINDTVMKYVKDGFSFCGAKPLAYYINKQDPSLREELVDIIISSKVIIANDKNISYRILLSLLGYVIYLKCFNETILCKLIKQIPMKAKVKDGSFNKDICKVVEKHFLPQLNKDMSLPSLDTLNLMPGFICDFQSLIRTALNGIEPSSKAIANEKEALALWVFGKEQNEDSCINIIPDTKSTHADLVYKSDPDNKSEDFNPKKFKVTLLESVEKIEKYISKTEEEIDSYRIKLSTEKENLLKQKKENEELKNQIDSLSNKIQELNACIANKEECIENQKKEIQTIIAETERLKSIIAVYSDDKQSSQSETLNAIASKLKQEYKDFVEAEDMEMTIDLGENLRDQIKSIFKILIKSGIDIKGR